MPRILGHTALSSQRKYEQPDLKKRKLASEWLIRFYHANPKRLDKLLRMLVRRAEEGKYIRFLEILINLLEGPTKDGTGTGDTYNFNFISEGERQRAQDSVKRIMAMRQKTITLIPEKKNAPSEQQDIPRSDSAGDLPGEPF